MKLNKDIKPGLAPLVVSSLLTAGLAFFLFLAIAGDSSGAPETGWAALIGTILLGPPLLIMTIITIVLFIRHRKVSANEVDTSSDYKKSDDTTPPRSI